MNTLNQIVLDTPNEKFGTRTDDFLGKFKLSSES
jgi:hypothetical protein